MISRDEDDAWRSIVDNYGELPDLGDLDQTEGGPQPGSDPEPATTAPRPVGPASADADSDQTGGAGRPAYVDPDDRFVPPTPPPVPRPTGWRAAAWAGLFGSPLLMLTCVVFGVDLPGILDLVLVGAFVGGFVYLIASLPRGRDPWDDGSRI